jgi:hypothetical protein
MPDSLNVQVNSVLDSPVISRVRRNHGLEHATLHILSERNPRLSVAGHSNTRGFWILGEVTNEELQSAVQEALLRLQNGEQKLAVHPNCGTNIVTAGVFAGAAGALAMFRSGSRLRDKLGRIPMAATLATLALIIAQPLGLLLQERVTTSGIPGSLEVVEIIQTKKGRMTAHRVVTKG